MPIPLKSWGVPSPDAKTIRGFMGPPLKVVLRLACPKNKFWSRADIPFYYKEKRHLEAQLFPHIVDLLEKLSSKYPLYITTTKNTPTAQDMTKNLGIHHFFWQAFMVPALKHLIRQMSFRQALQTHQLTPRTSHHHRRYYKFDMLGAQETGIQKLAGHWGFGERQTC